MSGRLAAALAATLLSACGSSPPTAPAPALGTPERCRAYAGLPTGFGSEPQAGMQRLGGGRFLQGSQRGYAEERPETERRLSAFWIDRTEVSNAQYARFVAATGYRTLAERQGSALVFAPPSSEAAVRPNRWWQLRRGADWRHPEGAGSDIEGRDHEPVVNVALADAEAYARWLGRQLPSEAQWEYAARAGLDNAEADAQARGIDGRSGANAWQGLFPRLDEGRDGFRGRAPVGCFAANGYGLHDMVGNVWEWTRDPWRSGHLASVVAVGEASDRRVIKGGSYLCASNWCARARAASRQSQEADLPAAHIGFRTVLPANPWER